MLLPFVQCHWPGVTQSLYEVLTKNTETRDMEFVCEIVRLKENFHIRFFEYRTLNFLINISVIMP